MTNKRSTATHPSTHARTCHGVMLTSWLPCWDMAAGRNPLVSDSNTWWRDVGSVERGRGGSGTQHTECVKQQWLILFQLLPIRCRLPSRTSLLRASTQQQPLNNTNTSPTPHLCQLLCVDALHVLYSHLPHLNTLRGCFQRSTSKGSRQQQLCQGLWEWFLRFTAAVPTTTTTS